MRRRVRVSWGVVVVVTAMVSYGVVGLAPHTHGDRGVPRLDTSCAAASSPVPMEHFHSAARHLPPRSCLACAVGPVAAAELQPGAAEFGIGAQPMGRGSAVAEPVTHRAPPSASRDPPASLLCG